MSSRHARRNAPHSAVRPTAAATVAKAPQRSFRCISVSRSKPYHENMPLSAVDLFAGVVAPFDASLLRRLDRLAIDRCHPRLIVPAGVAANVSAQQVDNLIPDSASDPSAVIVVAGPPRRKLVWNHPPLTTAPYQVKQSVEDFAQIRRPRPAAGFGAG